MGVSGSGRGGTALAQMAQTKNPSKLVGLEGLIWLRGQDLNPSGYEYNDCSFPPVPHVSPRVISHCFYDIYLTFRFQRCPVISVTVATRWRHENKPTPLFGHGMPIKISKRTVDALAAGPLPSIGYDAELKGLGVRLGASGSLSWFIEYRPGAGGRRVSKKRFYFGSREFTPEQARQTAKELLANWLWAAIR